MRRFSSVWYNAVVRGDINRIDIFPYSSIGENTVLHTAPSLPNGMVAHLTIGKNCIVGSDCTLYSCTLGDDVVVGEKSVILEGAKLEDGAQITAGSVVPPGRLIPTKQLWGGNPVQFIKDLNVAECWANYSFSYIHHHLGNVHRHEFSPWNNAYLHRPSTREDLEIDPENYERLDISQDLFKGTIKLYA